MQGASRVRSRGVSSIPCFGKYLVPTWQDIGFEGTLSIFRTGGGGGLGSWNCAEVKEQNHER